MRSTVLAVTVTMMAVLSIGAPRADAFSMGEGMATTGISGTLSGNASGGGVVGASKRVKSAMPKMATPGLDVDDGGSGLAAAARRRPGGGGSASAPSRGGGGGGGAGWKQGAASWASGNWASAGGGSGWASGQSSWAGGGGGGSGWATAGASSNR